MHFTLKQLQVFTEVARHNNVSRAAEKLSMSQSAASSALSELEQQLGAPLFDRMAKRLQLNEMGKALLPGTLELLARAEELEQLALSGEAFGAFTVGATLTIGNYLATLIIIEYMQQHPQSRLQLKVANTSQIIDGMLHFDIDVGLIEGDCFHPEIEVLPWREDELVVFCAPEHPLASQGNIDIDQLSRESWILREPGSGTRAVFDRSIGTRLSHVNILLELEHTEAIKRAVESRLGIGCISRLAMQEAFKRGSLVEIPTPYFDLKRQFHFLLHKQRYQTKGIRQFLDLCRNA